MKNRQKYLYILLMSAVLLLGFIFIAQAADTALPHFQIQSPYNKEAESVSIFDAGDGNYYVFLPSYADMEHVTVSIPGNKGYSLGVTNLVDGMNCSGFKLETPYDFAVNEQIVATLWFYQSANVATMYIDTASGSIDHIHADKNYKEHASLLLYTPEGTLDFQDELATLKGRGNSTWTLDKRPYALELSEDGNILEMGSATNWVLLANAYDETNLNNKLVLDLASRLGLQWIPESRWVDLYINGEYRGLYLLTEKVEVHDNRLNIDTNSGDFLCKIDFISRWHMLQNPFLSAAGRTIEISEPEILAESEQAEIVRLVNQMEQALLSETDLNNSTVIDLDSWVRRYLIDEIAGNIDSDHISSYFYYSGGKFYAGPLWDYDLSFGHCSRNQDPCVFIAKNLKRSDTLRSVYHGTLYSNQSFYNRMVGIYRTELRPLLQNIVDSEIVELSNLISKAAQSNSIRWCAMFGTQQISSGKIIHKPEELKEYLAARIDFLDSAWLENTEYCTVQFENEPGADYWNVSVPKGSCVEITYVNLENSVWVNSETGDIFDFSQPVTSDMILSKQITANGNVPVTVSEPLIARDYITLLSIAILFILLVAWMILDIVQRRKERSVADEYKRTKVSS